MAAKIERREVPALKVRQWISVWDKVAFSDREHRKKPHPYFYLFSLPAVGVILAGLFCPCYSSIHIAQDT